MNVRLITIDGETRSFRGWANKYGFSHVTVYYRMKRGMSFVEALTTPRRPPKCGNPCPITYNGVTKLKTEWAKEIGISPGTLSSRLKRMSVAEALTTPSMKFKRMLTHDGVTKPLSHWARDVGLRDGTLHSRLSRGMPLAEALTTPKDMRSKASAPVSRLITFNDKEQSRLEWMKELGITENTWKKMRKCGVSAIDILAEFHKDKTSGVVENFPKAPRDRCGSRVQGRAEMEKNP